MPLTIRDEQPSDITAIGVLIADAFRTAPHSSGTESAIVDALRRGEALTVSLVAEVEEEVVGHVAISPVTTSSGDVGWFGLGPIAVAPAWQGKGIGTQLMHASLARLRRLDASGCLVLGEPVFYSRFGFECDPALVLPGVPPEYFQAVSFGGARASGTVAYHRAFGTEPAGGDEAPTAAAVWPPELDALVAAPEQHRLVLENDRVRVLDTRIEPGAQTPVHTHQWPAVHHVVSWSPFVRRDEAGNVMLDSRVAGLALTPGTAFWGEALGPHTLENVGDLPIQILSVEIKSAIVGG